MKVYAVLAVFEGGKTELMLNVDEELAVTDFCNLVMEQFGSQLEPDELAAALDDAKDSGLYMQAMSNAQESVSIEFLEHELDIDSAKAERHDS